MALAARRFQSKDHLSQYQSAVRNWEDTERAWINGWSKRRLVNKLKEHPSSRQLYSEIVHKDIENTGYVDIGCYWLLYIEHGPVWVAFTEWTGTSNPRQTVGSLPTLTRSWRMDSICGSNRPRSLVQGNGGKSSTPIRCSGALGQPSTFGTHPGQIHPPQAHHMLSRWPLMEPRWTLPVY